MKLLTIDSREVTGRPGALIRTGEILDLVAAPSTLSEAQWIPYSIVSVLAAGQEGLDRIRMLISAAEAADARAREALQTKGVLLPYAGTALMAPIRRPGLVLVVDPDTGVYIKSPNTAVGNGATITVPWAGHAAVMGTAMLAVVIGREIFQAGTRAAGDAIAGYTLLIDLSMQSPGGSVALPQWRRYIESKQFPGASPIGPVIVTKDEIADPGRLPAAALINGVEVSRGVFYSQGLNMPEMLADLSRRYAFRPGDLVAIEPPADSPGAARKLRSGDSFSLRLDDLTELQVKID